LNVNFGLEINRPFFLVSKKWMNRVVECVGASNLLLKTLNRKNTGQQFFLDAFSQTIKSQTWKDSSMTIQSGGNSNVVIMETTTARWF
jgi:hypothetical protein